MSMRVLLVAAALVVLMGACASSPERVATSNAAVAATPSATTEPPAALSPTPVVTTEPEPTAEPTAVVLAPTVSPAPTATTVPTVAPAPTAAPEPTVVSVAAAVSVPNALPRVLEQSALPPGGEPLCVVGIIRPDTLNVRSGPGVQYEIRGALRPDACILRAAGEPVGNWQPVHVIVASSELVVIEGWVSARFVTAAAAAGTAEAAIVASDPASILGVPATQNPLLSDPCEDLGGGRRACGLSGWFWQEAPHPCANYPYSYWKQSTAYRAEAEQRADGSWAVFSSPSLVFDC